MPNTHETLGELFSDIADAIRGKTGGSAEIVADDFPSAIDGIPPVIVREVLAESATTIRIVAQEGEDFSVYNHAAILLFPNHKPTVLIDDYAQASLITSMVVSPATQPVVGWNKHIAAIFHATNIDYEGAIDTVHNPFQTSFVITTYPLLGDCTFIEGQRYTVILWRA